MGVSITAYSGLQKCNSLLDEDGDYINPDTGEYDVDAVQFLECSGFPNRADDVDFNAIYHYADTHSMGCMAYSAYNYFRNRLAELGGYPLTKYNDCGMEREGHDAGAWAVSEGPFWELICFSDYDGTLGTAVCAKLAEDFERFRDKIKPSGFREIYDSFHQGFKLAAQGGAVRFS